MPHWLKLSVALWLGPVREDPVCRRLMTAPGEGPGMALNYRATMDQPQRFLHFKGGGAKVGWRPNDTSPARPIMTSASPDSAMSCSAPC